MLSLLTIEQRRNVQNDLEKTLVEKLNNMNCMICLGDINIPVILSKDIYCQDCGDRSNAIACLHCVREWLQLNTVTQNRSSVKHLICDKIIDTYYLNASSSYKVDEKLIDMLDKYKPGNFTCKCGLQGSRRELRNHTKSAECALGIWKCPCCNFRGKSSEYIRHTQKCMYINNMPNIY